VLHFFMLDYDASDRRLSITVDNSDRLDALRALLSALRGSGIAPSGAAIELNARPPRSDMSAPCAHARATKPPAPRTQVWALSNRA